MRVTLLGLLSLICWAGEAQADCRPSASDSWSIEEKLSPRSGKKCLIDVGVYAGPSCKATSLRWVATFTCPANRRWIVDDQGALLMLRSSRVRSTENESIVEVVAREGSRMTTRFVRLRDLPALPKARSYQFVLDTAALHVKLEPEVTVDLAALETLGRIIYTNPLLPRNSIGAPAD